MYVPAHFTLADDDALIAIRDRSVGTLVVAHAEGFEASLVPWVLDGATLRGHVARPNPLTRLLDTPRACVVLFDIADAYVSPSWYPSKAEHHQVVPTWNYVAVHVHGGVRLVDDAAWLHEQIAALTRSREQELPAPWAVGDAPAEYIERMAKGIVGVEVTIERLEAKAKLSQNRSDADRAGVVDGLGLRPGRPTVRDLMTAT